VEHYLEETTYNCQEKPLHKKVLQVKKAKRVTKVIKVAIVKQKKVINHI